MVSLLKQAFDISLGDEEGGGGKKKNEKKKSAMMGALQFLLQMEGIQNKLQAYGNKVLDLDQGSVFGERALIPGDAKRHAHSAIAEGECDLMMLHRK